MSVLDVVRAVTESITKLPMAKLERAGQLFTEARDALRQATEGTADPDVRKVVSGYGSAIEEVNRVQRQLARAQRVLEQYLAKLGDVGATEPSTARVEPPNPSRLDLEEVEKLRAGLPPPVPKPNPDGKKTHGRWIDGAGKTRQLASGRDSDAEEAWKQLQAAGFSSRTRPAVADHVEMKLAAHMVKHDTRHADVVLNNRPCIGLLGCDRLLPIILPAGYSITVHGPDYRRTFTGGKKWSS